MRPTGPRHPAHPAFSALRIGTAGRLWQRGVKGLLRGLLLAIVVVPPNRMEEMSATELAPPSPAIAAALHCALRNSTLDRLLDDGSRRYRRGGICTLQSIYFSSEVSRI